MIFKSMYVTLQQTHYKSDFIIMLKIKEKAEDRVNSMFIDKKKQMFLYFLLVGILLGRNNHFI